MGIILTPKTTYTKSILIVVIFFIALLLVLFTATLHSQERPSVKSEGIALSVDVPGGDKGIILPKIELTDLSQYSPIKGQERDGLIIENTRVDATKGLSRGLYMWHEGRWDKLLTYRDVPEISGGTRVYTGIEDPNQSSLPEIVNAPNGSIYINKTTKIIFKKTDKNWTNELSIQGTSYTGSNTIAIKDDTSGAHLEAIAGAGIKLTEQGIAASIDTTTLTINQEGINAKNSEALWNANKLQGTTLETTTPLQGQTLRYDTSKKSWVPGNIKELPDGASEGQLLVWTGSVWSPQVSQKVDIKGNDIHFSGLTGYPPNGAYRDLLVIDSNGKVQRSFGNLWDLSGNKDPIGSGNDHILGFTDTTSTSNIVFKTKNSDRLRIEHDGKIKLPNLQERQLTDTAKYRTLLVDPDTKQIIMNYPENTGAGSGEASEIDIVSPVFGNKSSLVNLYLYDNSIENTLTDVGFKTIRNTSGRIVINVTATNKAPGKPGPVSERYDTKVVEIGYDYVYGAVPSINYAIVRDSSGITNLYNTSQNTNYIRVNLGKHNVVMSFFLKEVVPGTFVIYPTLTKSVSYLQGWLRIQMTIDRYPHNTK